MKLRQFFQKGLRLSGLAPNPKDIAFRLNRQAYSLGLVLAFLDIITSILMMISFFQKDGFAPGPTLVRAEWYFAFKIVLIVFSAIFLALAVLHFHHGKEPKWEGFYTLFIHVFALIQLLSSFVILLYRIGDSADFDYFYISTLWALLYLPIKPSVSFLSLAFFTFSIHSYALTTQNEFMLSSLPPFYMCMVTFALLSVLRYVTTYNMLSLRIQTEKTEKKLKEMSITDPLTGLHNRYGILAEEKKLLGEDLFILILDIDNFKQVNDTYGHEFGDKALKTYGDSLSALFGKEYVFRYGGDEFLAIQPYREGETESTLTQLQALASGMKIPESNVTITASAGYVVGEYETDTDLRNLVIYADRYLYKVKTLKKGTLKGSLSPIPSSARESEQEAASLTKEQPTNEDDSSARKE